MDPASSFPLIFGYFCNAVLACSNLGGFPIAFWCARRNRTLDAILIGWSIGFSFVYGLTVTQGGLPGILPGICSNAYAWLDRICVGLLALRSGYLLWNTPKDQIRRPRAIPAGISLAGLGVVLGVGVIIVPEASMGFQFLYTAIRSLCNLIGYGGYAFLLRSIRVPELYKEA